jgi:hypothetical protein
MEDYPFRKYIDERKHRDTDEERHLIKPIIHIIDQDFKGKEHIFCDKSQRDVNGKFRRPKVMIEAERRGFASAREMIEADKKAEEDNKKKEVSDLREFTTQQNDVIRKLIEKQDVLQNTIISQNSVLEEIIKRLKK